MSEKCSKEYDNDMVHGEKEGLNKKPERKIIRRKNKAAESKSEKKARRTLVVLTCLMAVVTVGVAVLGGFTDVFEQGGDDKAVAVLILPQEDKDELEDHLSKLWPLIDVGFDTEKMSAEEIFSHIRPYCEDGLYTSFGYSSVAVTHEADPAMRFRDENGSYCYYKIPGEEIDSILRHFGLESNHAINNESCYFYNSYYYFAAGQSQGTKSNVKVTILDNKRIQDGRYYVTASFGSKKAYVIASMGEREEGSYWKIHSMSLEPVFDSLGIKIKTEDETANRYEMRTVTFDGTADDGALYSRYSIKYPYFFGESQGEIQANAFYQSIITYYQQQSQQVQSDYKKFIKKGGDKESLPVEYHYTALVSLMNEENLCIISEIVESLPVYEAPSADESVKLPEKTIECYTFDLETGSYVSKDDFVGKDSEIICEVLYRIYNGYEYESLTDDSIPDTQVPADSGKIGEKIYNSASTLCTEGYVFCFVNDQGIREDVVIPFEILGKLTQVTEEN
jgi:hypothetical protein